MNDINAAAQELLHDQPMIIPIAGDFKAIQTLRDENVKYWGDDPIEL